MGSQPVELVCPGCRGWVGERWVAEPLDLVGEVLQCRGCARRYPVIDGIPIVLRDLAGWAESEGAEALRDRRIHGEVLKLLSPPGSGLRRNAGLAAVYGAPVASPYRTFALQALADSATPRLELGAGVGLAAGVRLDLNLALLRLGAASQPVRTSAGTAAVAEGGAVVADATDPPFGPASFGTVAVLNLLDSCRDPFTVLAQADALVRPGGTLLVSCAFAFDDGITPDSARFDESALLGALRGDSRFGPYGLECRAAEVVDRLEWRLQLSSRTQHVHQVMWIRAVRGP